MKEILEKRTYEAKHFQNPDGTFTAQIGKSPMHYLDEEGKLQDISLNAVDRGDFWHFDKANHNLAVMKNFGDLYLIKFDNYFKTASHSLIFEPKRLVWMNRNDRTDVITFREQQAVEGVIDRNVIRYVGAFGAGIDFEITFNHTGFAKEVVVQSEGAIGEAPSPDYDLVLLTTFEKVGVELIAHDKPDVWDQVGDIYESKSAFDVFEAFNPDARTTIREAVIYDADDRRERISVFWKEENGVLWQAKVVDMNFVKTAHFPIRFDTVIDTYSTTNSYQVVNDGAGGTYASANSATTGNAVYNLNTADQNVLHNSKISTTWYIRRADMQFDTSSLPSGAVISSATMTLYGASSGGGDTDGESVVMLNNSDNTNLSSTLATEDFNDFTTTSIGSRDLTDFYNAGANVPITFTDFSAIKKGSGAITRIGLRLSKDISATTPTGSNLLRVSLSTDLPYLTVTYSTGTTVSAGVVSSASSVPTPSLAISANPAGSTSSSASSTPTPTVAGGASVSAGTSTSISSVPSPTIVAGGISVSAGVSSSASSVPTPTVTGGTTISASVSESASSVPTPSYLYGVVLTPDAVVASATIPDPTIDADFWQNTYDPDTNDIWSDTY